MKRKKLTRRKSRKIFKRGAKVHKRNNPRRNPMRGGIRM